MTARLNILFRGMIAAGPREGGATCAVLEYLLGLRRLGHRVCFVEPIRAAKIRPAGARLAESENAAYFRQVVRRFGLQDSAALLLEGTQETVGQPYARLCEIAREADLVLNVSGMLSDEKLLDPIPV